MDNPINLGAIRNFYLVVNVDIGNFGREDKDHRVGPVVASSGWTTVLIISKAHYIAVDVEVCNAMPTITERSCIRELRIVI